jgi:hypothetical protein
MAQVWFVIGLYIVGILIGLLLSRQVPIPVVAATGFLWGTLCYSLLSFIALVANSYQPVFMLTGLGALGVLLIVLNIRRGSFSLDRRAMIWLGAMLCLYLLAALILEGHNISKAHELDPQSQILVGRSLALEGFAPWNTQQLSSWGFLLVSIQSTSVFLGVDYLYIFQPICGLTFLLTFSTGCYYVLVERIENRKTALLVAGICTLLLFSTYGIILEMEFINTNLISSMYLFTAFAAFWLGLGKRSGGWLAAAMLSLTGFALARTEAPVFAIILLSLVLNSGRLSYRERLTYFLPFLVVFILRYLHMVMTAGSGSIILSNSRILGVFGLLIAFTLLVLVSDIEFVEAKILPRLHIVMIAALGAALLAAIASQPNLMLLSICNFLLNLFFLIGFWGVIWYFYLVHLALARNQPPFEHERLFSIFIPCFFLLLLALVYFRLPANPFGYYWHDTSNRISTHIVPIILLYLAMKYGWGLAAQPESD